VLLTVNNQVIPHYPAKGWSVGFKSSCDLRFYFLEFWNREEVVSMQWRMLFVLWRITRILMLVMHWKVYGASSVVSELSAT